MKLSPIYIIHLYFFSCLRSAVTHTFVQIELFVQEMSIKEIIAFFIFDPGIQFLSCSPVSQSSRIKLKRKLPFSMNIRYLQTQFLLPVLVLLYQNSTSWLFLIIEVIETHQNLIRPLNHFQCLPTQTSRPETRVWSHLP